MLSISKGNEILPISEIVEKLTPRILSLVISDLKTKRLVGIKKKTFEEGRHPMSILLPQKLFDLGYPASH